MIQQSTHKKTAIHKFSSSFTNTNTNFMTEKHPKDQEQNFEKQVSRCLETNTQVSRTTTVLYGMWKCNSYIPYEMHILHRIPTVRYSQFLSITLNILQSISIEQNEKIKYDEQSQNSTSA